MISYKYDEKTFKEYGVITYNSLIFLSAKIKEILQPHIKNDSVFYFTLSSKVEIEDVTYDTYGIGAIKNGEIADYILDLSTEFENVKSLVDLCNNKELSLIHLRDVAEDFINS